MVNIKTVLTAQEIIDKAFLRASRIEEPYFPKKVDKIKREVMDRISTIEATSAPYLRKLVRQFPTLERLHPPFYRDLISLVFSVDRYKVSLAGIDWCAQRIEELSSHYIRMVKRATDAGEALTLMKGFYGRFASLVRSQQQNLAFLIECRNYIRSLPDIDTECFTAIVAGMPNVGKSSLVSALTRARPRVAPYPFTTQEVHIGFLTRDWVRVQLVDTPPGILDRPMEERNEMERKAVLALRDIDGIVLFLIDHSGTSGYTVEQQEGLYRELSDILGKEVIRVQSKCDLSSERRERICISATTGYGLEELRGLLLERGELFARQRADQAARA